jgi:putative hydrolase of the HAD superfamily
MYKALIFDLDNTLYDTSSQVDSARKKAIKSMIDAGLPLEKDEAMSILVDIVYSKGANYKRHFNELVKTAFGNVDYRIVASGIIAYHEEKRRHLTADKILAGKLTMLRRKGFKLAVVTDGVPVKQWEKIYRIGLGDAFHHVTVNSSKKTYKPAKGPYLSTAKKLGVKPRECLVFGDRLDKDIAGAHNAGMDAALICSGKMTTNKKANGSIPEYILNSILDLESILP